MATTYSKLSRLQFELKRPDEAERSCNEAIVFREAALAASPESLRYRAELAGSLLDLARIHLNGDRPKSEGILNRSISIIEHLVQGRGRSSSNLELLLQCLTDLANLHLTQNRLGEAQLTLLRSVEVIDSWIQHEPLSQSKRVLLGETLDKLNSALSRTRTIEGTEKHFLRSIQTWKGLVEDHPGSALYIEKTARAYDGYGRQLLLSNKRREAESAFLESVRAWERLFKIEPSSSLQDHMFAMSLVGLADLLASDGRDNLAVPLYFRAISSEQTFIRKKTRIEFHLQFIKLTYHSLSCSLLKLNRSKDAISVIFERQKYCFGDPLDRFNLACELSLCVKALDFEDAKIISKNAVDTLRLAVEEGWWDAYQTARDPDLAPIRHRKDFQAILQGLQDRAFPADPFAK